MSEDRDKINITTDASFYNSTRVPQPAITFTSLFSAITELYSQAIEIGWETKVLDDLTTWLRKVNDAANK